MNPSTCTSPAFGFNKNEHSTGMTVNETTNDALMLTIVAIAIGENSRPSTPLNASNGKNTKMINTVAYKIDERTSAEALAITSRFGRGFGTLAFSRKRRNTFSTSTIASSTTIPIATASPPSVIELTLKSIRSKTRIVMPSDSGIAVSVIKVIRTLNRNRNSTKPTMMAPSRSASSKFPIERLIKSDCR